MKRLQHAIIIVLFAVAILYGFSCSGEKGSQPSFQQETKTTELTPTGKSKPTPIPMPTDPDARLEAGKIAYNEQNYNQAIELLTPIVTKKIGGQTEALAWQFLAQATFKADKKKEGEQIFQKIRERYADDPVNLRAMVMHEGNIYWKNKYYKEALKTFSELIELGDKEQAPGVYLQIALVYRDADNMEKCRETLENIVKKYGYQKNIVSDAHLHLARCDLKDNDPNAAQRQVKLAEKKGGDTNQIAQLTLAITRMKSKDKEVAAVEKDYQRLLKQYKKDPALLNNVRASLVTYYIEKKLTEKAISVFKLIVKESPNDKQKQWAQDNLDEMTAKSKS